MFSKQGLLPSIVILILFGICSHQASWQVEAFTATTKRQHNYGLKPASASHSTGTLSSPITIATSFSMSTTMNPRKVRASFQMKSVTPSKRRFMSVLRNPFSMNRGQIIGRCTSREHTNTSSALSSEFGSLSTQSSSSKKTNGNMSSTKLNLSTLAPTKNNTRVSSRDKEVYSQLREIKKNATLRSLLLLAHVFEENTKRSKHSTVLDAHGSKDIEISTFDDDVDDVESSPKLQPVLQEDKEELHIKETFETNDEAIKSKLSYIQSEKEKSAISAYAEEQKKKDIIKEAFETNIEATKSELSQIQNSNDDSPLSVSVTEESKEDDITKEINEANDEAIKSNFIQIQNENDFSVLSNTGEAKKEKIIREYSASLDAGERAFAMLLELNMIELHPDPDDPDYDHSKDDLFAS